jgi:hypothetical protein
MADTQALQIAESYGRPPAGPNTQPGAQRGAIWRPGSL